MDHQPDGCAEFPNDNPELHNGASWLCSWTRAQPRPVLSAQGLARVQAVCSELPEDTGLQRNECSPQAPAVEHGAGDPTFSEACSPCPPAVHSELVLRAPPPQLNFSVPPPVSAAGGVTSSRESGVAPRLGRPRASLRSDWMPPPIEYEAEGLLTGALRDEAEDPFIAELQRLVEPVLESRHSDRPTVPTPLPDLESLKARSVPSTIPSPPPPELLEPEAWDVDLAPLTRPEALAGELHVGEGLSLGSLLPPPPEQPLPPSYTVTEGFKVPRPNLATPTPGPVLVATVEDERSSLDWSGGRSLAATWLQIGDEVAQFLLRRGATRAAALAPTLLAGCRVDLSQLSDRVIFQLLDSGIAHRRGVAVETSPEFRARAVRFRESTVLGDATAEQVRPWLTELVKALLGSAAETSAVATHLEQAGVFALLTPAA